MRLSLLALAAACPVISQSFYDMAAVRHPATLEIRTLVDWPEEPGDFPTRQKAIGITLGEWLASKKVRIPLVFVAPKARSPRASSLPLH